MIPKFELSGENESYKIMNLHIAVCYRPLMGYDFIMSDMLIGVKNPGLCKMEAGANERI